MSERAREGAKGREKEHGNTCARKQEICFS